MLCHFLQRRYRDVVAAQLAWIALLLPLVLLPIEGLAGPRLGNPNFAGKAPPEVVVGRQLTRTLPSSYFQLRHNIQAMRATFETNSWAEKQAKIAFRKDLCSVVAKTV